MTWDPAATQAMIFVGVMIGVVVIIGIIKSRQPEAPPSELTYSHGAWGQVLKAGEEIETQVPVLQPYGWVQQQIFKTATSPWGIPRQLAWTSRGALLLARQGTGNLWDRRRYEMGTFRVENVKNEGEYCVSLRLVLPPKKVVKLRGVPRAFLDRLRSRGIEVSGSSSV